MHLDASLVVTEFTHKFYSIDFENQLIRSQSNENQLRLSLMTYATNVEMVLANISPIFDFPAPESTLIQHIAGITVDGNPMPLEEDWEILADQSVHGFVLITFGSIAKTSEMPRNIWESLKVAMRAFKQVVFIVKYENTGNRTAFERRDNMVFTNWIPQMALMSRFDIDLEEHKFQSTEITAESSHMEDGVRCWNPFRMDDP
uniref:glucuronosyltransferase n=1 Tax=Bursaphelenchus xylophilus TaxID=6326 RepID=A0A1I7SJ86_BURXY